MAETVIHKISMKRIGRMTQLPDSQKIFGALIYMYAEQTSDAQATKLVHAVKDKRLIFSLSNLMPKGYLPVPKSYLLEQATNMKAGGKAHYQAVKRCSFIKSEQLEDLLKNPQLLKELSPYVRIDESQEIHAAIDSVSYQLPGLDPNLYSVPEITVLEVDRDKRDRVIDNYCFYLTIEANDLGKSFVKALKKAYEQDRMFFLGPRVSQGMNIYRIKNICTENTGQEKHPQASAYYLNLGMLLPEDINYQASFIDTFTSVRLPYKRPEGWDQTLKKTYISYISAGSILLTENGPQAAGKSISSEYDKERAIVFGNAMLYPIQHDLGRRSQ